MTKSIAQALRQKVGKHQIALESKLAELRILERRKEFPIILSLAFQVAIPNSRYWGRRLSLQ